jgi:predicted ATPase
VREKIARGPAEILRWKKKLVKLLDVDVAVVAELIPELSAVIASTPVANADMTTAEIQVRKRLVIFLIYLESIFNRIYAFCKDICQ